LGHGAGGGVEAPDLIAATEAATAAGVSVALVEQPYLVAGKRSQPAAAKLDEAWVAIAEEIRGGDLGGLPLIAGGRSAGARVACRTAAETGAVALLCLAFPLHSPGKPEKTRLDELDAVTVPVLVVQGDSDPFGMPPQGPNRTVAVVAGNHGLKKDVDTVAAAVREWLPAVAGAASRP
ncbi:MAG: alpha/beta hydrolase family protein, partial [Solirubrobacterales bacterium]